MREINVALVGQKYFKNVYLIELAQAHSFVRYIPAYVKYLFAEM